MSEIVKPGELTQDQIAWVVRKLRNRFQNVINGHPAMAILVALLETYFDVAQRVGMPPVEADKAYASVRKARTAKATPAPSTPSEGAPGSAPEPPPPSLIVPT